MILKHIKYYHSIQRDNKEVGKIQIICHSKLDSTAHLEYYLDEEYRNKGIMTQELKEYLERVSKIFRFLIAVVNKDNFASMRVLEKVGFIEFTPSKKEGSKFFILNQETLT